MKIALALASLSMLAAAPVAALANSHVSYTFKGYCDGVSLNVLYKSQFAGVHDGKCQAGEPAGGFKVGVAGVPFKVVSIATTDSKNAPGVQLIYWLNIKGLSWDLYYVNGTVMTHANSGTLIQGRPDAHSTAPASSAGLK